MILVHTCDLIRTSSLVKKYLQGIQEPVKLGEYDTRMCVRASLVMHRHVLRRVMEWFSFFFKALMDEFETHLYLDNVLTPVMYRPGLFSILLGESILMKCVDERYRVSVPTHKIV